MVVHRLFSYMMWHASVVVTVSDLRLRGAAFNCNDFWQVTEFTLKMKYNVSSRMLNSWYTERDTIAMCLS